MILFFYILEILIVLAIIGIVMMQKGSDGAFARDTKLFGIRGRSSSIIKLTYFLGGMFLLNSIVLNILYNKQYKASLIQTEENVVVKKDVKIAEEKKNETSTQTKIAKKRNFKQATDAEIVKKKQATDAETIRSKKKANKANKVKR